MDPIELVHAHHYVAARKAYESRLKRRPNDGGYLDGHALALLCLGSDLELAVLEFTKVNKSGAVEMTSLGGKTQPNLEWIGTTQWLLGKRDEAIATFRAGAEGILNGSIEYGDMAGGASHGLLLWYAAVATHDDASRDFALKYLEQLEREHKYGRYGSFSWPQPVALYLLGRWSRQQVLRELVGADDAAEATIKAKHASSENKAIMNDLVQAIFYLAADRRARGDEPGCKAEMVVCANIENPITAVEWFLARAEAGFKLGSKKWPWSEARSMLRSSGTGRRRSKGH